MRNAVCPSKALFVLRSNHFLLSSVSQIWRKLKLLSAGQQMCSGKGKEEAGLFSHLPHSTEYRSDGYRFHLMVPVPTGQAPTDPVSSGQPSPWSLGLPFVASTLG